MTAPTYPAACDACPTGTLSIDVGDGMGEQCDACGHRTDRCDCGAELAWDATMRGTTIGGLVLVGWRVCSDQCGAAPTLCRRSRSADAVEWRLAKGGRSLTAGGVKVRAEGTGDHAELMARLVRVPELEAEIERLREQLARRERHAR